MTALERWAREVYAKAAAKPVEVKDVLIKAMLAQ